MRFPSRLFSLALLLLLRPACGGGGGGGGPAGTGVSMPALPLPSTKVPANAVGLGTTYPPLAPETGTLHTLDATPGVLSDSALQAAIQALMNGGGRISLTTTGSVLRTLVLTAPFHVDFGSPKIIVDGNHLITLDGNFVTRMFDMQYQTSLTVQRMDFQHGRAAQSGGAIDANNPVNLLTVIQCTFTDCQTLEGGPDRGGGAIRAWNTEHTQISECMFDHCAASNGGAVNSLGSRLTILNSVFVNNAAFGTGGGGSGNGGIGGAVYVDNVSNSTMGALFQMLYSGCIFNTNVANTEGGAIFGYMNPAFPTSAILVDACTFAGNVQVQSGSGGGAIYTLNGVGTITNSTFNDNTSASNSGALRIDNATATVTNCTFTGNHGVIGGAIGHFSGALTLNYVTVADNLSDTFAAGIFQSGGTATVNKSIFANNTAPDLFNGWHTNTSLAGGGNIQWPTVTVGGTTRAITATGTTQGDPQLNPLADNTGPTWTRSLGATSAAIGVAADPGAPATDQRGVNRVSNPDAGAFEN